MVYTCIKNVYDIKFVCKKYIRKRVKIGGKTYE